MAAVEPSIDFEWTFVAGSNAQVDVLLTHPELEAAPSDGRGAGQLVMAGAGPGASVDPERANRGAASTPT